MPEITAEPDAPRWERLGSSIRTERQRQGLSRERLAGLAGVSAKCVQTAEGGRVPLSRRPYTLDAIERALGWTVGSISAVLEGGEPEHARTSTHRAVVLAEDLSSAVRDVVDPAPDTDVAARTRTARRLMAQLALELDEITDTATQPATPIGAP